MNGLIEQKKVKVFLTNGFKFEGNLIYKDDIKITIKDDKDGKTRSIPWNAINIMEEVPK